MKHIAETKSKCKGKVRYPRCLRCGKRLKSEESQKLGFGKVCWEKHTSDRQQYLL